MSSPTEQTSETRLQASYRANSQQAVGSALQDTASSARVGSYTRGCSTAVSPSVAPNSVFARRRSLTRACSISPVPRRAISPIGISVVQRCAQMAEQIAETAISGVGCVEEEMRHARSVPEIAIAKVAAASSCMESNVAHVAVHNMEAKTAQAVTALAEHVCEPVVETEARTSHTIGFVVQ